jgi:hypothetical protein
MSKQTLRIAQLIEDRTETNIPEETSVHLFFSLSSKRGESLS